MAECCGSVGLEIPVRNHKPVFETILGNLELGASVERGRHNPLQRDRAKSLGVLPLAVMRDCFTPGQRQRGLPPSCKDRPHLDKTIWPGKGAIAHGVDCKFMQREADVKRSIGVEERVYALEMHCARRVRAIPTDLSRDQ